MHLKNLDIVAELLENSVMESHATYKCPRCEGTEIYFAKRQRITGSGGIYGNKARMVKTALCKSCGELADWTADPGDVRRAKKIIALTVLGLTAVIVIGIWANSTISTM